MRSGAATEQRQGRFDAEHEAAEVRTLNESFNQLMDSIAVKRRALEERTAELTAANVVLTDEISERTRVEQALRALKPDAVLVEGPPEAEPLLALATHRGMRPPVALLAYAVDEPGRAAFYPFARFSPEWSAFRYALAENVPLRLIDLPLAHVLAHEDQPEDGEDEHAVEADVESLIRSDEQGVISPDFRIVSTTCAQYPPLNPHASCILNVVFDPSATGVRSATELLIFNNGSDFGGPTTTLSLGGIGSANTTPYTSPSYNVRAVSSLTAAGTSGSAESLPCSQPATALASTCSAVCVSSAFSLRCRSCCLADRRNSSRRSQESVR